MSEHFEPAAGCRCGSCLELRGCVEQAEVWQARATQAEARVAVLEGVLRAAFDHLQSNNEPAAYLVLKHGSAHHA